MKSNFDNLKQINTNTPRETYAYDTDGLIIKTPTRTVQRSNWVEKQRHAKQVADSLVGKSRYYFIPKTLEVSSGEFFVVEEKVPGQPLHAEFFNTLNGSEQQAVYTALAHFFNDMHQSRPVLTQKQMRPVQHALDKDKIKRNIPNASVMAFAKARSWFDAHAELGASVVFSHHDMNQDNIFFDRDSGQVSFIDFADASYENIRDTFVNPAVMKLHYIDGGRLAKIYADLPKKQKVVMADSPEFSEFAKHFYNACTAITSALNAKNKNSRKILIKMLSEALDEMQKKCGYLMDNSASGQRGLGAIGPSATRPSR